MRSSILWGERVIYMDKILIHTAGNTAALRTATEYLQDRGVAFSATADPDVTHLLLPVPSFEPDGRIKGGGILEHTLADLPENVTVIGGNLHHPVLVDYKQLDLLQDECYLAQNAAITADCAVHIAGNALPVVLQGCPVLIIGWGRIGKCLARRLRAMGASVTVAARRERDRAMLRALGYGTENTARLGLCLLRYRLIINTAPYPVLTRQQVGYCAGDCLLMDLASEKGIDSPNVIWARGLPGKDAPESSGKLIFKTVTEILGKE